MAQTTLREYLQITEDAISSGRIEDAVANCQHILSHFPDSLEAQRLMGEVYLAQGQLEEAQQTFDWILANDPENVITYCNRALTSERMSDIDTALDCYQQAYELSHGNSQIRQEFNQLSAKVGQQEFMFSRAGLARLYMRGDLLTQAVQEWEAVLNASPERLDARTGLLETYWREGTYDKVEQLAQQILEEIPTCLKALLLLAHVTSSYNLERAKELIKRAEVLDPELVMAHELFGDLIASQPNNPFLASLKKEPIVFNNVPDEKVSKRMTASNAGVEANGSQSSAESVDRPSSWSNLESWSELDTMLVSEQTAKPVQEASAIASWSDVTQVQNVAPPATGDQVSLSESAPEGRKSASEINADFDPAVLEQQPWFQADQHLTSTAEPEKASENQSSTGSVDSMHLWSTATQEDAFPTPPAWLDMLTKIDRQPSGPIPISSSQSQVVQELPESTPSTQPQAEPELTSPKLFEEDFSALPASPIREGESAFFFTSEDNDSDMEWPEWLKSLGAETMERNAEPAIAPEASEMQQSHDLQAWSVQIDQTLSEVEKEQIATLEHLENDLRAQGFVPLQPGSLSTFAEEPSLSSALAELGNLTAWPDASDQPGVQAQPVTHMQPVESTAPAELASPLPILTGHVQPAEPAREPLWGDIPQGSEMPTSQVFEPEANPLANTSLEAPLMPAYRADALLENELETTMRRPAVRLQSMQHSAALDPSLISGRGRTGEHGKAHDENLSNKERLLRGYQFQLAGAYDDAMQEYRIIIRNAPEMLGEVISNVRALLKLTPRYSVGYRVLGDAYMRQGEYLQAMEAYNKALTIAKKVKSLSS